MKSPDLLLPGLSHKALAAMDFAAESAAREKRHRNELEGVLRVVIEAIDALDDLAQHLIEMQSAGASATPANSVSVLIRKLLQQLRDADVVPMNAVGCPLDLQRHEVIATRQDMNLEEDTVVCEQRRGYLWKGRLLRYAQVIINKHC